MTSAWPSPAETHRCLTHALARQPITCQCLACGRLWISAPQSGQGRPLECPTCASEALIYSQSPLAVIASAGEAEPAGAGGLPPAPATLEPITREEWTRRVQAATASIVRDARQERAAASARRDWYAIGIAICVIVIALLLVGLAGGLD